VTALEDPLPSKACARFSHAAKPSLKELTAIFLIRNCENPRLTGLLRANVPAAAPIPVTRLWTACTRLKMRELQTHNFH
jgi:hypothetical protein